MAIDWSEGIFVESVGLVKLRGGLVRLVRFKVTFGANEWLFLHFQPRPSVSRRTSVERESASPELPLWSDFLREGAEIGRWVVSK